MVQSEEKRLPMLVEHIVTRLQDSIVVFGGIPVSRLPTCNGRVIYSWINHNHDKHTIWMYDLHTDWWRKFVIPENAEVPPLLSGATAVTIKTDIYMFAAPKDNIGTVWQLKRDIKGCFSWRDVPVKKAPSYRHDMAGWEYAEKMWIFGGCGPSPADGGIRTKCYKFVGVDHSINNQLLCFDPSCSEWTTVKCAGAVPSHRCECTSVIISNIVWLYGGNRPEYLGELYNLDMNQLVWIQIQCKPPIPKVHSAAWIFMGRQLVLHGDNTVFTDDPKERWVLDLSSLSWREYKMEQQMRRWKHKSISGLNNYLLIGGFDPRIKETDDKQYKSTSIMMLEPKSLQAFAIKTIIEHKDTLPWSLLPNKLHYFIMRTLNKEDVDDKMAR